MTEQELQELLYEALLPGSLGRLESGDPDILEAVLPFKDAGVLTNDFGLVISTPNGDEFQVGIVRSA